MAFRERIPNPNRSRQAVSKTKDISCDSASHVTVRHNCRAAWKLLPPCLGCDSGVDSWDGASHLLWLSLCDETCEDSCDVYRLLGIRRSPMSQWAHLRRVVAVLSFAYCFSIHCKQFTSWCGRNLFGQQCLDRRGIVRPQETIRWLAAKWPCLRSTREMYDRHLGWVRPQHNPPQARLLQLPRIRLVLCSRSLPQFKQAFKPLWKRYVGV